MPIQYVYPKYFINSSANDIVWRDENTKEYIPSGSLGYSYGTDYTLSGIDEGTLTPNNNDWISIQRYEDGQTPFHSSSPSNPLTSFMEMTDNYIIPSACILNINVDTVSGEVFGFKGSIRNGNDTIAIATNYTFTQFQSGTELLSIPMTVIGSVNRDFRPVLNLDFYQPSGNVFVQPINSDFRITALDVIMSGDATFIHKSCDLHCCGDVNLIDSSKIDIYDDRSTNSYVINKRQDEIHDIYPSFNVDDPNMMSTRGNFSLFNRLLCNEGSGQYIFGSNISGTITYANYDNSGVAWHYNKNLCSGPSGTYAYEDPVNYVSYFKLPSAHEPLLNGTTVQIGPYDKQYTRYDFESFSETFLRDRDLKIHKAIPSGHFSIYTVNRYGLGIYNYANFNGDEFGSMYLSYAMGSDLSINVVKSYENSTINNQLSVGMKKLDGSTMNMSTTLTDLIERKMSRGFLLTYDDRARLYGIGTYGNTELLLTSEVFTRSNTSGDLTVTSTIPITFSEFGSLNSGLSTADVNRFNDYLYKVFDRVPEASGDLSRFSRINMPQRVEYFHKNYYCTLNDQLTVSGDHSINMIPSGAILSLSMDVEYTGTNPSGFYLCPYIVNNNQTIFSPVGTNDGIRIFPQSGVHNITFSSPILNDVTPASSLLMLDIVSKATHAPYSGGDFTIYGKSLTASPLFEYDPTETNKILNLHTLSSVDMSGNVDLTVYSPKVSNTVNLFINSDYQTIYKSADMYISGLPMSVGKLNLITTSRVDDASGQVTFVTYSTTNSGLFNSVPMITTSDGSQTSMNMYVKVDDLISSHSGSLNLFIGEENRVYNNVPLTVYNDAGEISSTQQLYIQGNGLYDGAGVKYGAMNLFIARDSESTDGQVMMIVASTEEAVNSVDMIIEAANILTSGVDLITTAIDSQTNRVTLYSHGF